VVTISTISLSIKEKSKRCPKKANNNVIIISWLDQQRIKHSILMGLGIKNDQNQVCPRLLIG
jgi:hypothetical protein